MQQQSAQPKSARLLTIDQVAERLGMKKKSIYNSLHEGRFPIAPKRIGRKTLRWRESDIDDWINS